MMKDCRIVEDLLPLYEEELVQDETRVWLEQHLASCEDCRAKTHVEVEQLVPFEPVVSPEKVIAKTQLKLSIYQILFVILSFVFAMNTTLFSNLGFQFILSYFVLGAVTFYFYRSWLLTIAVSFLPVFVWSIYDVIISYDTISKWWEDSLQSYNSGFHVIYGTLTSGVFMGILHTIFTCLGVVFVKLLLAAFNKRGEEA